MTYPNVTLFPERFIQGDVLDLDIVLAEYPASAYSLSWALVTPTGLVQVVAQEVGEDFWLYVTSAYTAVFPAGEYFYQVYITDDTTLNRITVGEGYIEILADFDQQSTGYNAASHAKTVLDAINAVIENRATVDQESYSIEGRSLNRTPLADLLKFRETYRKLWRAELKEMGVLKGKTGANIAKVRFV